MIMVILIPIFLICAFGFLSGAKRALNLPMWKLALGFVGLCAVGALITGVWTPEKH